MGGLPLLTCGMKFWCSLTAACLLERHFHSLWLDVLGSGSRCCFQLLGSPFLATWILFSAPLFAVSGCNVRSVYSPSYLMLRDNTCRQDVSN